MRLQSAFSYWISPSRFGIPSPSISISYLSGTPCLSRSHLSPAYIVFSSRVMLLRLEWDELMMFSEVRVMDQT